MFPTDLETPFGTLAASRTADMALHVGQTKVTPSVIGSNSGQT